MLKRVLLLLLFLITMTNLCGCKNNQSLHASETLEIKLSSNSSAQMYWDYDLTKEGIVDITKSYYNGSCGINADGCSGGFNVYTIRPLKEGTVTINFRYIYGGDTTVSRTATYKISVTSDHKITETHTGTYFDKN